MPNHGDNKKPVPDWIIGRASEFKGIWIPGQAPFPVLNPGQALISSADDLEAPRWRRTPFGDGHNWQLVCDLFKAHNLDPANPHHWQELILKFAIEHRSRQGGRRLWTEARLCVLAADFELAQRAHPGKSDTYVCKLLTRGKFTPPWQHLCDPLLKWYMLPVYNGMKWKRIQRLLPEARRRFAELIAVYVGFVRNDFQPWTADHEAMVKDWLIHELERGGHPSWFLLRLDKLTDTLRVQPPPLETRK
jgi:hypothetical protein